MNKVPKLITNESIVPFDVDETLVHHKSSNGQERVYDERTQSYVYFDPYDEHILLLKQMSGRGRFIIVWSAGGNYWANLIVNHLGLAPYVDLIMTKPVAYVDDIDANHFMTRIFLSKLK